MERLICFVRWLAGKVSVVRFIRLLILIVGFVSICLPASAAWRLVWDQNQEQDLAGYRIHFGQTSGNYVQTIDVSNVTEWLIPESQPDGYFAATAYDTEGLESGFSNEVFFTRAMPPSAATGLVVQWEKKQISNIFWITGGLPAGDIGAPHSGGSTFYITGGLPGYDQGGP